MTPQQLLEFLKTDPKVAAVVACDDVDCRWACRNRLLEVHWLLCSCRRLRTCGNIS